MAAMEADVVTPRRAKMPMKVDVWSSMGSSSIPEGDAICRVVVATLGGVCCFVRILGPWHDDIDLDGGAVSIILCRWLLLGIDGGISGL